MPLFPSKPGLKFFVIAVLLVAVACKNGGDSPNTCFSITSPEPRPCFDANEGGGRVIVTGRDLDEFLDELRGAEGFVSEPEVSIAGEVFANFPFVRDEDLFDCLLVWQPSELVIRNDRDWQLFRKSCFFSHTDLPDVDFAETLALVFMSAPITDLFYQFSTVIEFEDKVTAIVEVDPTSNPIPGGGLYIGVVILIPVQDKPVEFIRVEACFSNEDIATADCAAEAFADSCGIIDCGFVGGGGFNLGFPAQLCESVGCDMMNCSINTGVVLSDIESEDGVVTGIYTDVGVSTAFTCPLE